MDPCDTNRALPAPSDSEWPSEGWRTGTPEELLRLVRDTDWSSGRLKVADGSDWVCIEGPGWIIFASGLGNQPQADSPIVLTGP